MLGQRRRRRGGFSLFKTKTPFSFEPGDPSAGPDSPVLSVGSKDGNLEMAVLIGMAYAPQFLEEVTKKFAITLVGTLPKGYASIKAKRFERKDKRTCWVVPFSSRVRNGLAVAVAGEGKTFFLLSTFQGMEVTEQVGDLTFMQLSLEVLPTKR